MEIILRWDSLINMGISSDSFLETGSATQSLFTLNNNGYRLILICEDGIIVEMK